MCGIIRFLLNRSLEGPDKVTELLPSGRTTLIFRTDIRLFMSLWMLSATPGYWDEYENNRWIKCRQTKTSCQWDRKYVCMITWIFMAISLPSFNTPWCTWPMEAAANGLSSKDNSLSRQPGPSSSSRTFYTIRRTHKFSKMCFWRISRCN